MTAIVCIDDRGGMLFNKRRQSRDRVLIEDVISDLSDKKIYILEYSKLLFEMHEGKYEIVDDFLNVDGEDAVCFVENVDITPYKNKINKLVIYKWNRVYPADFYFPLDLKDYKLTQTAEFAGSSHENVTREVYEL